MVMECLEQRNQSLEQALNASIHAAMKNKEYLAAIGKNANSQSRIEHIEQVTDSRSHESPRREYLQN